MFTDRNSTNFPLSTKNTLEKIIKDSYKKDSFLQYHQFIVYNYLINNDKSRGILLYHEMGMGKSITSIALAEFYRQNDPSRKIVILLAKSLQKNYKMNIKKFIKGEIEKNKDIITKNKSFISKQSKKKDIDDEYLENTKSIDTENTDAEDIIDRNYKFISLNASNMYSQITKIEKSQEEIMRDKHLKEFNTQIEGDDFLENTVLIIDEYHNLSNSIVNGSSNAIKLYDKIMNTKNLKLIFLTGTPIINNPFELAPTFNMLNEYKDSKTNSSNTLFPELKKDFDKFFINDKTNSIKNKNMFQNRIFGLCSYFGNIFDNKENNPDFPIQLKTVVERVPMSPEQFARYTTYRDSEIEEASVKKKAPNRSERFSTKSSSTSSYRVKTRQVSNYLMPESSLTYVGKKVIKHIDKLTKYDLTNLNIFSPKFKIIIENINKHKNQLGLFYSEFVSGEGIGIFSKILEINGYKPYQNQIMLEDELDELDEYGMTENISGGSLSGMTEYMSGGSASDVDEYIEFGGGSAKPTKSKKSVTQMYAVITGNVEFSTREKIINIFNSDENKHGSIISLLLISKTGAEGLDLKNIRHIHICEPYWNMARVSQIIARGVRYKSHISLPKSENNVQPYIYLSDYPVNYKKKKKEETTDVKLYIDAKKNELLINEFNISLIESSIDCNFFVNNVGKKTQKIDKIKCKMCIPNNKELFNESLIKQMELPDPCDELTRETIKAKEIIIDDNKYYYIYTGDNYHIFKFDENLKGFIELQQHQDPYSSILNKILKL